MSSRYEARGQISAFIELCHLRRDGAGQAMAVGVTAPKRSTVPSASAVPARREDRQQNKMNQALCAVPLLEVVKSFGWE
jgi:hypothetical protein